MQEEIPEKPIAYAILVLIITAVVSILSYY
jgi:hypothetical protein